MFYKPTHYSEIQNIYMQKTQTNFYDPTQ